MFKKLKNFLFYDYHRPSAKIYHFFVMIKKIFYNSKTSLFSERILLLKLPPESMIYYNSLGRLAFIIRNFISIIFLRKFFEKSIKLEDLTTTNNFNHQLNYGVDDNPWPHQAMHLFEKETELEEKFYIKLEEEYINSVEFFKKEEILDETKWWNECRNEFKQIFFKNGKIDIQKLKNFRNDIDVKAEILLDQNFISRSNSTLVNKIRSLSLINLYHKLSEHIDLDILRKCSESKIGNNYSTVYRNQRIGYRILRYAYYTSQIRKYTNLDARNKNIFLDIGGGYGGLSRVLKYFYSKSTFVITELPELNLLANYFLTQCFPSAKVGTSKDFKEKKTILKDDLNKYDFVLINPSYLNKFENNIVDISINTTSLGEMTNQMQKFYINQIERITSKYFYSVNRAKTRVEKYNSNGFYDLNLGSNWQSLVYGYTHTYHIEFLGKKIEY
jgi:putative sugar O-methyltransferase